jgi:heptosyltransferase-2
MATPALKAVRTRFPGAQIAWLVKPYGKRAVENLPLCDEILEYDDAPGTRRVLGLLSWAIRLRRKEFDLAIILPNSFSSALMVFLAGIKRRVGYSRDTRGFMLTDPIKPVRENSRIVPVPMVEYYLRITDSLGCPRVTTSPELSVSPAAKEKAHAMLDRFGINQKGMTVAMIPGAAYGSSKCWKPEYFAQAADQLTDRYGCHVLIVPGPEEVDIAKDIEKRMHHSPVVFADPIVPLDVLMALIQSCSLVITNDTGPRHFAVALKKPVVVIMGPTDPRYTNSNLEKTIVLREDLECSPCHLKICPRDHRCMTAITPDQVVQASEQLLDNSGKDGKRVI